MMAVGFMAILPSCGIFGPSEPSEVALAASPETGIYISINTIMGKSGRSIHSCDGYFLSIKDGKAKSYLPFFGEVYYTVGYGTSPGIVFEDCPVEVREVIRKNTKAYEFVGTMSGEQIHVYFEYGESGNATITCNSDRRSMMRYMGEVVEFPEEPESSADNLVDYIKNKKAAK